MLADDDALNTAGDQHLNELVARRLSRRSVMGGGLAAAAAFLAGGSVLSSVAPAGAATGGGAACYASLELVRVPMRSWSAERSRLTTSATTSARRRLW